MPVLQYYDHNQNQTLNWIDLVPPHSWLHDSLHVSLKLPMVFDAQDISSISSSIISHGVLQRSSVLYSNLFPNAIILEHVLSSEGKLHVWGTLSSHTKSNIDNLQVIQIYDSNMSIMTDM